MRPLPQTRKERIAVRKFERRLRPLALVGGVGQHAGLPRFDHQLRPPRFHSSLESFGQRLSGWVRDDRREWELHRATDSAGRGDCQHYGSERGRSFTAKLRERHGHQQLHAANCGSGKSCTRCQQRDRRHHDTGPRIATKRKLLLGVIWRRMQRGVLRHAYGHNNASRGCEPHFQYSKLHSAILCASTGYCVCNGHAAS